MSKKPLEIRASAASRWFKCPGSVSQQNLFPEQKTSIFAAEGTVAHMLCELFFNTYVGDIPIDDEVAFTKKFNSFRENHQDTGKTIQQEGFDIAIKEEMLDAVLTHVCYVRDLLVQEGCDWSDLNVEFGVTVDAKQKFTATIDQWFRSRDPFLKKVHVIDFKYGKGLNVEAKDNPQLLCYASGVYNVEPFDEVFVHICQPRITYKAPCKQEKYTGEEILAFKKLVAENIKRVKSKAPEFADGDHCRWCSAKEACPLLNKTLTKVDAELTLNPTTPEEYGMLWTKVVSAEKLIKAAKETVTSHMDAGGVIAGYKKVPGKGKRQWVNIVKAEMELEKSYGDKIYTPKVLKSPAQIDKIKGVDKKETARYCASVSTTFVLEKEGGGQKAVSNSQNANGLLGSVK